MTLSRAARPGEDRGWGVGMSENNEWPDELRVEPMFRHRGTCRMVSSERYDALIGAEAERDAARQALAAAERREGELRQLAFRLGSLLERRIDEPTMDYLRYLPIGYGAVEAFAELAILAAAPATAEPVDGGA